MICSREKMIKAVYSNAQKMKSGIKYISFLNNTHEENIKIAEIVQVRALNSVLKDITLLDEEFNNGREVLRTWIKFDVNDFNNIFNSEEIIYDDKYDEDLKKCDSDKNVVSVLKAISTIYSKETNDFINFNLCCLETINKYEIFDFLDSDNHFEDDKLLEDFALRNSFNQILTDKNENMIYRFSTIVYDKSPNDLLINYKSCSYGT